MFFNNSTWSLLEEYIIQSYTETVNVRVWTDFINHLQEREQMISNKAKKYWNEQRGSF